MVKRKQKILGDETHLRFPLDLEKQHAASKKRKMDLESINAALSQNKRIQDTLSTKITTGSGGSSSSSASSSKSSSRQTHPQGAFKQAPSYAVMKRFFNPAQQDPRTHSSTSPSGSSSRESKMMTLSTSEVVQQGINAYDRATSNSSSKSSSSTIARRRAMQAKKKSGAAEKLRLLMRQRLSSQAQKTGEEERKKRQNKLFERRKLEDHIRSIQQRTALSSRDRRASSSRSPKIESSNLRHRSRRRDGRRDVCSSICSLSPAMRPRRHERKRSRSTSTSDSGDRSSSESSSSNSRSERRSRASSYRRRRR
uniref:Uncharacterized protein n=1 Tax=Lotharella oceanica TaxID=641309 RepID=A0A7S2TWJ2_9EUKA